MRVVAIVQARMSSRRLPGKSLASVAGKPLLGYLLERLRRSESLDGLVVATSVEASDDPVAAFCEKCGVTCVRGPLDDVAGRFLKVLDIFPADAFVRICGDSPLLDTALVDRACAEFRAGGWDLVTNVLTRDHPDGQSVEVAAAETFRAAYARMNEPGHFEHVTLYFYQHPEEFRILDLPARADYAGVNFVVDTPEDLAGFSALVARMNRPHWAYDLDGLVALARTGQETER